MLKKNLKEPTRPKAEKLHVGAQPVKYLVPQQNNYLGAQGSVREQPCENILILVLASLFIQVYTCVSFCTYVQYVCASTHAMCCYIKNHPNSGRYRIFVTLIYIAYFREEPTLTTSQTKLWTNSWQR